MKRIFLNLRIALRSLYSFKLRTSLAVLGVFLGTFLAHPRLQPGRLAGPKRHR